MSNPTIRKEVSPVSSRTAANLVHVGNVEEKLFHAEGIYHADCLGPVESEREEYLSLRNALFSAIGEIETAFLLRRDTPGKLDLNYDSYNLFLQDAEVTSLLKRARSIEFERKWQDVAVNLVVTVGKNSLLDTFFAGSAYTAAMNMFLIGTGTVSATDIMASHGVWLEVGGTNAPAYTGNRPAPAWATASGGSKSISAAQNFAFTSSGTVAGAAFVSAGSATKDTTTGVLVSAGDFSGGSKAPANGDQLNVSWSISV